MLFACCAFKTALVLGHMEGQTKREGEGGWIASHGSRLIVQLVHLYYVVKVLAHVSCGVVQVGGANGRGL